MKEGAKQEQKPRPIAIEDLAEQRRAGLHEENLKRRNPRHGAGGVVTQLVCLVVGLKDADACYPAEGGEETAPSPQAHHPGRGGLNGAGPGGRAGGASTSLVFSLSWPDGEDEASFLVLGSADPVSIPMAMAVGIPAEED